MDNIGKGLGCLLFFAIAGVIIGGYLIWDNTGTQTIESKVKVKPDFRLEADGKKVDTVWVYKFK